jgi:hypothetical protein
MTSFSLFAQESVVGLRTFNPDQANSPEDIKFINYALPDNNGTSGNSRAPQGTMRYIRTVYLITQAELINAGIPAGVNFNSIGFVYSTAQNLATTGEFKVYFQNTSHTAYGKTTDVWTNGSTGIIDEMTLVSTAPITIPAATGSVDFPLSNPSAFTYSGGGIYVAYEYQNPSGTLATAGNVALCNTTLAGALKNAFSATALPSSVGATASAFRPGTRLGYAMANDAAVVNVYTFGKLPLGFGVPHTISAAVRNTGDEALASVACTLKVTGANTFTTIKTVSVPVGATVLVTFDPFRPFNEGIDTVTVTLADDGNSLNNTFSVTHVVNNTFTFAYSNGAGNTGSLGFNPNNSGSFVTKYYVNGHAKLNSAKIFIGGGIGKTVRGIAYDKTGTAIAQTDDYVIQQSDSLTYVNFEFPVPPVITKDSLYVGLWVAAVPVSHYPMGLQREVPTRPGAFFIIGSTGTITDVAANGFGKFMVEATFSQNPVGELLFSETFTDYTNGNLAGQNGWMKGGSGPDVQVSDANPLSYTGYDFNGGSYMSFPANSGTSSRVYKDFADTSISMVYPGSVVYMSLLVNLSATYTTATGYFFSLGTAPNTTNYFAKLFAKKLTDTTFNLGVSKTSNTASFSDKVLNTNETHLIVVRYNVNNNAAGQSGNTCYMWINPTDGNEPDTAAADAKVFAGQPDYEPLHISSVLWHNRGINNPLGSIDGIRVAGSPNSSAAAWTALAPGVIPVEMTSFTSAVTNGEVVLSWTTATEVNNRGFEVERKNSNSNTWINLGFVKGNGNSLSPKAYSFVDQNVTSGKFSYRLKQVDHDGSYKYSDVINAEVGAPDQFSLSQNYPNPFNPSTRIDYQVSSDSKIRIELYSITGQKIADLVNSDHSAGFYSVTVNTSSFSNLASGLYIYKMTAIDKADGKSFVNTRKMVLIK